MLENFFKLNGKFEELRQYASEADFYSQLDFSKDFRNAMYMPNLLGDKNAIVTKKIEGTKFKNFSFRSTSINRVTFINCDFTDCLFTGVKFKHCELIHCRFTNSNFHKCDFKECLADPAQFEKAINWRQWSKSNISVHLFSRLFRNAQETHRPDYARVANYNFNKWETRLLWQKYFKKKPYSIKAINFYPKYFYRNLYWYTFGYGYRLRNFILTFIIVFVASFLINKHFWNEYGLKEKDVLIESFNSDSVTSAANFFYTADLTTKLVDSQIQPTSNLGMMALVIQSFIAFALLSALITILANKLTR